MQIHYNVKEFYRAHLARDARFDGMFFVAIKTTGIYCRPICQERKSKLQHLEFFITAAQAIQAGYCPCLRCHPESAPGSNVWLGTAPVIQRALRLMEVCALDNLTIAELAAKLPVGERWLRALFQQQVGVSPLSILLTKKLDLARNLLEMSTLPLIDIAFGSGFQSFRRFSDAFKKQFQQTPSRFHQKTKTQGSLCLQLTYRPPYDTKALLHYLKNQAIEGVEQVDECAYQRLFTYGAVRGWFKVTFGDRHSVKVDCKTNQALNILEFVARLKNLFDLDADPMAIEHVLIEDTFLAPYLKQHSGLRVPGCWDGFEVAIRAVIGQQISVKAAHGIFDRLVKRCGEAQILDADLTLTHYFPTPEQLMRADLTGIGLPLARVETIKTLAKHITEKTLILDGTADETSVRQRLLAIKGIGPWTVEYIAMRALKNPNAFFKTDLEVQKRIKRLKLNPDQWTPWRAYGTLLLLNINLEKVQENL